MRNTVFMHTGNALGKWHISNRFLPSNMRTYIGVDTGVTAEH